LPGRFCGQFHQFADALHIDGNERIALINALADILSEEARGIIAR
jgi:hypothetical protein